MNPTLEIFSQGEEVVTGQTVDTNAAWLAQESVQLGFNVTRHTAVGDKLGDLVGLLREIATRADCCLCTGGLGPTSDDLTAEAVAEAFALPLQFDPVAYAQIERFFNFRNRPMAAINRKQALLPAGARRIDNDWGTAPGFALQYQRCWFVFLPGVPSEMRHLFDESVRTLLTDRFSLQPGQLITLKTLGIGESDLQTVLAPIALPEQVQLGFRAGIEHVETKLLFPHDFPRQHMTELVQAMAQAIGAYVFGIDGPDAPVGDLADVVNTLMNAQQRTAAFVESASQGLLAAKCIGCNWLLETRFNRAEAQAPQNPAVTADWWELAKNLAAATQQRSGADLVLVQLYQGDDALFHDKDLSIVLYNVLLTTEGFREQSHTINGTLKRKQNQAALLALDFLRRYLQDKN
ncbi:MAG: competence/damage-inducible protein A [Gammaproteobacteria bacterium HGW-Gammaproteobacteria-3]|nr:MAG: competence/damage-inducible protein A [Gammaproteobacteria bacterium HGW-Gammaproteobacteria-3]